VKAANETERLDEIRLAQVILITSTSRMLDAADDVKRKRDHLLELLGRTQQGEDSSEQEGDK
jgi:hypothetical protein